MSWWQEWLGKRRQAAAPVKISTSEESPAPESAPRPPVALEITDVLDLHAFAPRDVKDVVEAYLEEAHMRGYRQVRIIHGKGIGVQREIVRSILRRSAFVVHYEEAPAEAGSWGATVAQLRTL